MEGGGIEVFLSLLVVRKIRTCGPGLGKEASWFWGVCFFNTTITTSFVYSPRIKPHIIRSVNNPHDPTRLLNYQRHFSQSH